MIWIKRFIMSLQFLTKIPIPIKIEFTEEDFGKCVLLSPLVGIVLGGILALVYFLLAFLFPPIITGFLTLVVYVFLTGGLHLDGLGDTFDGVFSYREKEKILEIMKDSRLGTNGLLVIVFLLLLDGLFIGYLPAHIAILGVFLMPVAGKISVVVTGATNHYIDRSYGMSKTFVTYCNLKNSLPILLFSLLIFGLCFSYKGLVLFIIIFIFAFLASRFFARKIGGVTGDVIGAVVELTQLIYLISIFLLFKGGIA